MDITALIPTLVSVVASAAMTGIGVYVALSKELARMSVMIDNLRTQVEKHNSVIERTYRLEEQAATLFKEVERLDGRIG